MTFEEMLDQAIAMLQRRGRAAGNTGPDEAAPRIVAYLWVGVEEFVLQIIEDILLQLELPLEGTIGDPATPLEHGHGLLEHLLKGHRPPSLYRCGVQKTVWEWNRPFRRMYTAHG